MKNKIVAPWNQKDETPIEQLRKPECCHNKATPGMQCVSAKDGWKNPCPDCPDVGEFYYAKTYYEKSK